MDIVVLNRGRIFSKMGLRPQNMTEGFILTFAIIYHGIQIAKTDLHQNEFRSTLAGVTVEGRAHPLSAWFVLALRLVIGFAFLYSGTEKVIGGFDSQPYLANVAATNGNPLEGLFLWMGQTSWFVEFANIAVPWGEVAIGLGIMVGLLTRLAAFFGALMMLMFYFGNWDVGNSRSRHLSILS